MSINKFYWNIPTPIHLCILYGGFCAIRAESSGWDRDLHGLKYWLHDPLQKKGANTCTNAWYSYAWGNGLEMKRGNKIPVRYMCFRLTCSENLCYASCMPRAICPAHSNGEANNESVNCSWLIPHNKLYFIGQKETERQICLPYWSVRTKDPDCPIPFLPERILIKCYWILIMHYCRH